jgi:hypothetical protein
VALDLREVDLIDNAERAHRQQVLEACIAELVQALRITGKPDPWGSEIKVTDDFLDPLFRLYFERLGTPQQIFKRDYHGLADALPLAQIDPEITQVLDVLLSVAQAATPAG